MGKEGNPEYTKEPQNHPCTWRYSSKNLPLNAYFICMDELSRKRSQNVLIWRKFSKIVYEITSENKHRGDTKGEVFDLVGIAEDLQERIDRSLTESHELRGKLSQYTKKLVCSTP